MHSVVFCCPRNPQNLSIELNKHCIILAKHFHCKVGYFRRKLTLNQWIKMVILFAAKNTACWIIKPFQRHRLLFLFPWPSMALNRPSMALRRPNVAYYCVFLFYLLSICHCCYYICAGSTGQISMVNAVNG